ncbi:MAG: preprotein translocase subunit SecG [Candidatus Magasanikbacteria bacterium]|nr:preprotein translocase subunit SecG [Candidatus Magasanikbacteria bacterium]
MKETIISVLQLVTASLLIIVILLQQKGAGLGGVFGGSSNIYSTKRGVDKILHYATVVIAIIFFGSSILRLIVAN